MKPRPKSSSTQPPLAVLLLMTAFFMLRLPVGRCLLSVVSLGQLPKTCQNSPFGGVGPSGMGAYQFKYTYDVYTHHKTTLIKKLKAGGIDGVRYPPYKANSVSLFVLYRLT